MSLIFCQPCGGGYDIEGFDSRQVERGVNGECLIKGDRKACRAWIETLSTEAELREWKAMWLKGGRS